MADGKRPKIEEGHIGELTHDPMNARKHNPKNLGMIERSLNEVGAGRSIVATSDGVVIAGNGVLEAAAAAGIEDVEFIHTDGKKLIVHVRDDLVSGDKMSTMLGLYDNRTAELSEWDPQALIDINEHFGSDPQFDHIFGDKDFEAIAFGTSTEGVSGSADTSSQLGEIQYRVVVECSGEEDQVTFMEQMAKEGRSFKALMS